MKMNHAVASRFTAWSSSLLLAVSISFAANHATYLPLTFNLDLTNTPARDDFTRETYGGSPSEFTSVVVCPLGIPIGQVKFSYDTWNADYFPPGANWDTGGGVLAGGFWAYESCQLKSGWQWGWVQIVEATISGNNVWNAPNLTWFPDTATRLDPDYPYETLPAGLDPAPNPLPTKAFQDWPNRFPANGYQSWVAELGLVCKNFDTHQVCVAGSLTWGFLVTENPAQIMEAEPHTWHSPSTTYLSVLSSYFDGMNGSQAWTFSDNCCCCIPEPSSLLLAWVALVLLLPRRARLRKVTIGNP